VTIATGQLLLASSGQSAASTGILSGRTGYLESNLATTQTIPLTINTTLYYFILNPASGTLILPTVITYGQVIIIRSNSTSTCTISATPNQLIPINSTAATTTTTIASGACLKFYGYSDSSANKLWSGII